MRFNVSGKALQTNLQAVSRVINSKNTMQILGNFLLRVEGECLTITGGDQETAMTATMEIYDVEGSGEIAVGAKRLLEVIKEISNQPLNFDINLDTKEITLRFNNGHFNFMGVDAAEYPTKRPHEDDALNFSLPGDLVLNGLEGTIFAVSDDDSVRPIMTGILWDVEPGKVTFVSSDTHKLVKYESSLVAPEVETKFILPAKVAGVLKGLLSKEGEEISLVQDQRSVTFTFGSFTLSSRLIKGVYPNYRRVIPKDNPFRLVVNRESLLNAVRRVALFASEASHLIKFNIRSSEILMAAQDLDCVTSAEERVDCDYQGNDMMIGFSSVYMTEVLSNLKGEDVEVELADPARPGLFSPLEKTPGVEIVMLQMPMQVIE